MDQADIHYRMFKTIVVFNLIDESHKSLRYRQMWFPI